MKRLIISLFVLLSIASCGKEGDTKKEKGSDTKNEKNLSEEEEIVLKKVKVQNISPEFFSKGTKSSGTLEPVDEVLQITESGGDVVSINYKNGQCVNKGAVVMKLDNKDIATSFSSARANLDTTKADLNTKQDKQNKYYTLYKERYVSQVEYHEIRNAKSASQGNYNTARSDYARAKKDFEDLTIRAKRSGRIANLNADMYENIAGNGELFTIVDDSRMSLKTGISGVEIGGVKNGSKVEVKVEGKSKTFTGRVTEVNPIADEETKKFAVTVELNNSEANLKKGMYAEVLVEGSQKEGILVPQKSIIIKELVSYIFIEDTVIKNGKSYKIAKEVPVELGYELGDKIEVISKDLGDNFKVITEGQFTLVDGDYIDPKVIAGGSSQDSE